MPPLNATEPASNNALTLSPTGIQVLCRFGNNRKGLVKLSLNVVTEGDPRIPRSFR